MSPEWIGSLQLIVLIGAIFIGWPISFTLLILGIIFGYIGFGARVFDLAVFQTLGIMKEETFAAVPLFIFMGHVLEKSDLMERLFKSFQYILAPVRGSLYLGLLLTATLFAAATGIVGASVTVMGLMAAPTMIKCKYDSRLSAGAITAGGTLGILIPPSVMLIVMGPILGVSVGHLYAAAVFPGLVLSGLFIGYCMIRCLINPALGPPLAVEERPTSYGEIIKEFLLGIIPLGGVIFAALGSILFGLATATEAGAMGALGALALMVLYRRFKLDLIKDALYRTLSVSSMVLFLATTANIFGAVFTKLGTGTMIAKWLVALPISPFAMLILLMFLIFLLGWPLEWPPIIFIFVPILLPVITMMKYDMVWFATLLAVNLQTAFLSPPVAVSAYYLKAVAPQWEMKDIYIGMGQFMVLQVIGLMIVLFFPVVALWLPRLLYK